MVGPAHERTVMVTWHVTYHGFTVLSIAEFQGVYIVHQDGKDIPQSKPYLLLYTAAVEAAKAQEAAREMDDALLDCCTVYDETRSYDESEFDQHDRRMGDSSR